MHDLQDTTSAEAYCTLGGDVVPMNTAQTIGDKYALQSRSSAPSPLPTVTAMSRTVSTGTSYGGTLRMLVMMGRQKNGWNVCVKKVLFKAQLEVYVNVGYVRV